MTLGGDQTREACTLEQKKKKKKNLVHIVRTVTNLSSGICPVGETRGARAVHVARGTVAPGACAGVLLPPVDSKGVLHC